jgi:ABC-type cobalamin/Fe3+-siderophores transport system ATPase subunit
LGPNGSGKTTYLKRFPSATYFGEDQPLPFDLSVNEILHIACPKRVEKALQFWGIEEFKDRKLRTLSGGERQKVLLARAFGQDASTVFLDETGSRLDMSFQPILARKLHEWANLGKSIVLVSHDLPFALTYFDEWWFMSAGQIQRVQGLNELIASKALEKVFQIKHFEVKASGLGKVEFHFIQER